MFRANLEPKCIKTTLFSTASRKNRAKMYQNSQFLECFVQTSKQKVQKNFQIFKCSVQQSSLKASTSNFIQRHRVLYCETAKGYVPAVPQNGASTTSRSPRDGARPLVFSGQRDSKLSTSEARLLLFLHVCAPVLTRVCSCPHSRVLLSSLACAPVLTRVCSCPHWKSKARQTLTLRAKNATMLCPPNIGLARHERLNATRARAAQTGAALSYPIPH